MTASILLAMATSGNEPSIRKKDRVVCANLNASGKVALVADQVIVDVHHWNKWGARPIGTVPEGWSLISFVGNVFEIKAKPRLWIMAIFGDIG